MLRYSICSVLFSLVLAIPQAALATNYYNFQPRITVTPGSEANPQNQTDTPVPYEVAVRLPLYKKDPADPMNRNKVFPYYSPFGGTFVKADFNGEYNSDNAGPDWVYSSDIKSMDMTFPGAGLSVGLANKLAFCSEAQLNQGDLNNEANCPADSQIASVKVLTHIDTYNDGSPQKNPQALNGKAFIGSPNLGTPSGDVYPLFISIEMPLLGQYIKIVGSVIINKPDLPPGVIAASFPLITNSRLGVLEMKFSFRGGPEAAMVNPVGCGTHTASSHLVPLALRLPLSPLSKEIDVQSSMTTSFDGNGGACPAVLPFNPSVSAKVSSSQIGGSPVLETSLVRPDRDQRFKRFTLKFPTGSLAKIASVRACPVDAARVGGCSVESKIGDADVVAGSGPAPVVFPGSLYLTAPFVEGHPAGMVMKVQAKAGPLDLGEMNIPMDAEIESGDNVRMKISTIDPLPTMFRGIPVSVREARIRITREGFLTNRTSCEGGPDSQLQVEFEGVDGSVVQRAQDLAYTGCDSLPFSPSVEAKTTAQAVGGHSPLQVTIHADPGQPAISGTDVTIPSAALALDAGNIKELCSMDVFRAGQCAGRTVIGRAQVDTPMLANPVNGNIVILQPGGSPLPKIGVDIRGDGIRAQLIGELSLTPQGLLAKFRSMPDFQATKIFMEFSGGPAGVMKPREGICAKKYAFAAKFYGHSGASRVADTTLGVDGCSGQPEPKVSASGIVSGLKHNKPVLQLDVSQKGGDTLRAVSLSLPAGAKLSGKQRKGVVVKTAQDGEKSSLTVAKKGWKLGGKSFRFQASGEAFGRFTLKLSGKAIKLNAKLRKKLLKSAAGFKLSVTFENGKTVVVPVKFKARR